MNLQEFLDYRKNCPLCDTQLKLFFHSKKQQSYRYEDGRLIFLFNLSALKKGQLHYKAGYSFGLKDNSYYIEFYTKDEKRFDNDVPEFLRERFEELNKNLIAYRFFKYCPSCSCYNYSSERFNLMPTNVESIGQITIDTEYIGFAQQIDDGFKIIKLLNNYTSATSSLIFGRQPYEYLARDDGGMAGSKLDMIQTPIIKFVSKEETLQRLNKLIVFS